MPDDQFYGTPIDDIPALLKRDHLPKMPLRLPAERAVQVLDMPALRRLASVDMSHKQLQAMLEKAGRWEEFLKAPGQNSANR